MGVFLNNPSLKRTNIYQKGHDPKRPWELQEILQYYSAIVGETLVVRKGYKFDGASVPWFFRRLFPKAGGYMLAACVHDFCCDNKLWDFKTAARVFLEAMGDLRIPKWQRYPMWLAVRLFGPRW